MTWDITFFTVNCIYDHLKNQNNIIKKLPLFFNDGRYLPVGTFNVLIKQTVCLTPLWSGLFWWGNNIKKQQTKILNNSVTGEVKLKIKTPFSMD